MIEPAARAVYSALLRLAQPLLRGKLARRGRSEPGYLQAVPERFGHYDQAPGSGSIWLHAVSLGETRAAAALVERLRAQLPGMRLLLTSGTATGRAEAARLLQPGDLQVWQPWDTPGAVGRFLDQFEPRIGILMETEIWPNLCAVCARRGIPLVLANARLSEKSLRRAEPFGWFARPAYRSLAAVWAQTDADAQRLARLGAPVAGVFGNLKFDARPDAAQLAQGRRWRAGLDRPVLMLASSRDGEEAALLRFLQRNAASTQAGAGGTATESIVNRFHWLIVPRHPQRFDEVARAIVAHGFALSRRSAWHDAPPAAASAGAVRSTIWLGDSLGEMALYYALSDVALLGGSFEPLGGQNLIEAAACGCPIVLGPHTFNFAEAAALALQAGAAFRVASLDEGVARATRLLETPHAQRDAAERARAFSAAHRDAAERTARAIAALLGAPERNRAGHPDPAG